MRVFSHMVASLQCAACEGVAIQVPESQEASEQGASGQVEGVDLQRMPLGYFSVAPITSGASTQKCLQAAGPYRLHFLCT